MDGGSKAGEGVHYMQKVRRVMNCRKYQNEDDQQQIRQFLQEVFLKNDRRENSWPLYRWDYWCWHENANLYHYDLGAAIFLWQDDAGKLIGVLILKIRVKPSCRCILRIALPSLKSR